MKCPTSGKLSLLPISAPTKAGLEEKLESCKNYLKENQDKNVQEIYQEVCKDLNTSHGYRAAIIGKNGKEAFERLEKGNFIQTSDPIPKERPKLCFGFSGFGHVYPKMGHTLFQSIDCYKNIMERMQLRMKELDVLDFDIINALYGEDAGNDESASFISMSVAATTAALAEVWETWGLKPDMVLGHSIGEYSAARMAGIYSFDDYTKLLGLTIESQDYLSGNGMIATIYDEASIFALVKEYEELIKNQGGHTDWLEITARNAPAQTVVGGTKAALEWFMEQCKKQSIVNIPIPGERSFHCQGMEPFMPVFKRRFECVQLKKPKLKYISSMTGNVEENPDFEYFAQHLRRQVNFVDAVDTAVNKEKAEVFLEVGPGKMTISLVQAWANNCANGTSQVVCLPSIIQGKDELETMLNSAAQLFILGFDFNWDNFYASFSVHKKELNSKGISTCINNSESRNNIFKDDTEFRNLLSSAGTKEARKQIITSYIHEKLKVLIEMEEVPLNVDLRDLGMDSTKAIQLKNIVHAAFEGKVNLGFNALLQIHTLTGLAEHITTIFHDGNDENEKREKEELKKLLLEDSVLWPHINATEGAKGPVPLKEIRVFLLTGATGQLAPYLLEELTQRKETKKVYCLIRTSQGITPEERLVKQLKKIDMLERVDMTKVEAISGNVIPEKLGMDTDVWNRLIVEVDAVINCAVHSNHLAPYAKEDEKYAGVRAVNVIGTQRILEFACAGNKIKWVYQGSTILSYYEDPTTAPTDGMAENWPPSLDDPEYLRQLDQLPNFGYGLSKLVADRLVYEATLRGIPCKAFRFGKIAGDEKTGKMDVLSDHFFCKFLHYLISGTMPDFDIPLIEMTVDACAKVSLKIFFHEGAKPSDIYNMRPPYNSSELDIAELSEEFGVPLRLFALGEKLLQENKDEELKNIVSNLLKIAGVSETPSSSSGDVMDDIPQLFENEKVMSVLKPIYGYPMRILPWSEYKKELQLNGENSFIANWLEFYTSPDSIYQLIADKKFSVFNRYQDDLRHKGWWTAGKVLPLLPDLDKIVEHPMDTVRREILYVIHNAREVFGSSKHFHVPKRGGC